MSSDDLDLHWANIYKHQQVERTHIECFSELGDDWVLSRWLLTGNGQPFFCFKLQQTPLTPSFHCSLYHNLKCRHEGSNPDIVLIDVPSEAESWVPSFSSSSFFSITWMLVVCLLSNRSFFRQTCWCRACLFEKPIARKLLDDIMSRISYLHCYFVCSKSFCDTQRAARPLQYTDPAWVSCLYWRRP